MEKYINCQVKKAGFYYIGHLNCGSLEIYYEGGSIRINPSKCQKMYEFLYHIFGIDSENGVFFEDIKGKYFRIWVDEHYKILSIGHIVNDYFIDIKEITREE